MCNTTKNDAPSDPDIPRTNQLHHDNNNNNNNSSSKNDNDTQHRPPNLMSQASLLSRLFFQWAYPLLKRGMERPLQERDLPTVMERDSSAYNRDHFAALWQAECQQHPGNPSLHRALLQDFFKSLWFIHPLMCLAASARVMQAVALGYLIESFEENNNSQGYLWAGVIVLCGVTVLFEHHHVFFLTWRKGMRIRVSAVAAIYEKSLKLSSTHQDTMASYGKIMNLASNDVERFLLASIFISYLFWSPLQSIAILITGCFLLGPAFAAGFGLLIVVFVPLQFILSQRFAILRSKIASITDQRVNFVSQAVRGARVMKMSGYEWRFLKRIQDVRQAEVDQIARANRLKALNEALFFSTNVVVALVTFLVHVLVLDQVLTPGDVFTVFTLINILQLEMTKHVSLGVMGASECYVSVHRIQRFLEFPELPSEVAKEDSSSSSSSVNREDNVVIRLSNVKSYWNEVDRPGCSSKSSSSSVSPTSAGSTSSSKGDEVGAADDDTASSMMTALDDVSVDFYRGQLTAIIGTVGSGKSALCQALVKELPISSGSCTRNYRTIAYASQDPWIMDGTVRDNIVMGLSYDEQWYNTVVKACGLILDFSQLRDGDETVVGDRGVQCSGGQRARIGLARAIYRDADVLVADDPLSAVDAKVGRQLFQEAIFGLGVDKGKCVVLATHQHQYLSECRCILVDNSRIACIGSYKECVVASNGKLTAHEADSRVDNLGEDPAPLPKQNNLLVAEDALAQQGIAQVGTGGNDDDNKEMNIQGLVRFDTFVNYLRAMGGIWTGFFLFILFSATQAAVLLTIATFGRWAERDADRQQDWDIIGLAFGLTGVGLFLSLLRAIACLQLTIRASQRLHDRMAEAVLRAKVAFFDTNPLGRILNRFSADVGSNDDLLPPTLFDFMMIAFMVIGAVITTVSTIPFSLVAFPPLMWYFLSVRRIFVTSTRELKRLEGLARSPIFAMIGEALGGIATIRANDCVDFFREKFKNAHDAHTRAFSSFIAASRWVGFRMDSIMFLFLTIVCFLSVLFHQEGWFKVDPAILGLSISMLLQLAGLFQWMIRQSAEVVNQMVSVERVLAFGKLEPEAPLEQDDDVALLKRGWPKHGNIDVEGLTVRYRPSLPPALKNVSFRIPEGSRVGVVGRTGSGKSTLTQALFRLLEAEEGRIIIDGVDVSKLGLHALRTNISVIPQVPTLFSGCTVRENLDLFGLHSDEAIRNVLDDCHLTLVMNELPNGWDSIVAEGGSNFSVGQRQLLCLARAILSHSRILILDEATASVDRRTDKLLQDTLSASFSDGTIIAVAHRLDTVIDNDLILVLGGGKVLEFGSPAELIRAGGPFSSMVNDTGDAMAKELKQRALAGGALKLKK